MLLSSVHYSERAGPGLGYSPLGTRLGLQNSTRSQARAASGHLRVAGLLYAEAGPALVHSIGGGQGQTPGESPGPSYSVARPEASSSFSQRAGPDPSKEARANLGQDHPKKESLLGKEP